MAVDTSINYSNTELQTEKSPVRIIVKQVAQKLDDRLAQIINQIHYWLIKPNEGEVHNGYKWIYNRYEDWCEQFPWFSIWQIGRFIRKLEKLGILIADNFNGTKWYRTKWYRIDYECLFRLTGWMPREIPIVHVCTFENAAVQVDPYIQITSHAAASEGEKNKILGNQGEDVGPTSPTPPADEKTTAIAAELKRSDLFSAALLNISLQFSLQEIQQAIAICQERQKSSKVHSFKGLFRRCLEGKWWLEEPNTQDLTPEPIPADFDEWFAAALTAGIIAGRIKSPDDLPLVGGQVLVTIPKRVNQLLTGEYAEVALTASQVMQQFPVDWLCEQCVNNQTS